MCIRDRRCYDAMNDDFQTQLVISYLFEACHIINTADVYKRQIVLIPWAMPAVVIGMAAKWGFNKDYGCLLYTSRCV